MKVVLFLNSVLWGLSKDDECFSWNLLFDFIPAPDVIKNIIALQ